MTPARFWSAFALVGLGVEAWGLSRAERNDWTASPNIRRALRSHTPAGRLITIAFVGTGSAGLAAHLIAIPPPKESS